MKRPSAGPGRVALTLQLAAGAWLSGLALASPATHKVRIARMKYDPPTLEASVGDTIEWANEDLVPHTVTAIDGTFDSGKIEADALWKTTVTKKGTFPYKCSYHVPMKGTIVVK